MFGSPCFFMFPFCWSLCPHFTGKSQCAFLCCHVLTNAGQDTLRFWVQPYFIRRLSHVVWFLDISWLRRKLRFVIGICCKGVASVSTSTLVIDLWGHPPGCHYLDSPSAIDRGFASVFSGQKGDEIAVSMEPMNRQGSKWSWIWPICWKNDGI